MRQINPWRYLNAAYWQRDACITHLAHDGNNQSTASGVSRKSYGRWLMPQGEERLIENKARLVCLGPDGAAAHAVRTMKIIQGCWKLPILFRLYVAASLRNAELKRNLSGVSQKMLTQHLRKLEKDGPIQRHDFEEKRRPVEYRLSDQGQKRMGVFLAMHNFSVRHLARDGI